MPGGDDLETPFIFVPHGDPEPVEWMARHPGYVKIPATFVPHPPAPRPLPPVPAAALVTASGAAAASDIFGAADLRLAAMSMDEMLAGVAGPLAAVGILLYPSRTAGPELDELPPLLRPKAWREATEAFVPPAPTPHPPGLVPPVQTRPPGEGGFTPGPSAPKPPGFAPDVPRPNILSGRSAEAQWPTILHQDRNEGLEGATRTDSKRARNAARAADPAVTQTLHDAEWRAHHLINLAGIRAFPDLIREAAKAGWRTDDVGNVAPLPASPEARQKLQSSGIDRPVHDNGHPKWNDDVEESLAEVRMALEGEPFAPGSEAYAKRAREKLEELQRRLRQDLIGLSRLTWNEIADTESAS